MSCGRHRPLALPRRFLFLLLLLSWASNNLTAFAQCLPEQSAALLRLKQGFNRSAFGRGGSSLLPSWRPGTDCCQGWEGVTCDRESGRVVALDLSNSSLSGNVDPALFNLSSLTSLNLACNQLSQVQLPSWGFEKLANLTHLNLSDSGFSGQVPVGISRLTHLVSLDLSVNNYCTSSSLRLQSPGLKTLLQGLANLKKLYLDGVNISAGGHDWGPALSSSVPNLQELSLSGCSLSGPIDDSFSALNKSLAVLRLHQNNLSSEVPEFLGNFSSLRLLRLSYCGLRGSFPSGIFLLRLLQSLDVSKNPMLSGRLPDFPAGSALKNLLLSDTKLSGNLPVSMGNLRFLKTLKLSGCNFSGTLPPSFGNLTQLVFVDLSVNNFRSSIPSFRSSANISELDIHNNFLTGPVPGWLFSLPSLQTLQLNSNHLSGDLGEFDAANSRLEIVDLGNNKLQGPIPRSVSKLQRVKVLRFASNNMNGTVGLDLFRNLRNLSILDISNNMLTVEEGSANLTSFPNVSTLNLASCNMVDLPGFLRKQAKLARLDLSNNRMVGLIPTWLWNVSIGTLEYLNLSHNSFTGFESPPDFSGSAALVVLDIHSNNLTGSVPRPPPSNVFVDYSNNRFNSPLPPDIGSSLSFTILFSVSNSSLTGEIPESICNSTYLQVLDLSHNSLTGQIPQCLFGRENDDLQVLNLRGNSLSGALPPNVGEGCKLRTLNLNGNRLVGALPQSLASCKMLEVLDLGNNGIEGPFPSWLGELPALRVLVLRSNKFHGAIRGPSGGNYTFSSLQIMDLSSNGFNGSLPSQCFGNWKAMTAADEGRSGLVGAWDFLNLSHLYYQDAVTVTVKGLEMTLVKILTIFTSIDISNNNFEGSIPEELGQLRALYVLNMSCNGLTGRIPSNIASLTLLESLDLSRNHLRGEIPQGLASLNFLSVLNLAKNQLVGQIPQGRQISTFSNASFEGNQGLCGPPLSKLCTSSAAGGPAGSPSATFTLELNWEFIFVGLGLGSGLALVMGPFMFWSEGRRWYNRHVDRFLWAVVPAGLWLCSDCNDGRVDAEEMEDDGSGAGDDEGPQRCFCVFCTQLEFSGQRATIRHVECSCALEG